MVFSFYVDGACSGNPGPGGWGVVLAEEGRVLREWACEHPAATTNNRMELHAALAALREARARQLPPGAAVIITDSTYVQRGATTWCAGWARNGWRTRAGGVVRNAALWQSVMAEDALVQAQWRWTRGHVDAHSLHARADALARQASMAARRGLGGGQV